MWRTLVPHSKVGVTAPATSRACTAKRNFWLASCRGSVITRPLSWGASYLSQSLQLGSSLVMNGVSAPSYWVRVRQSPLGASAGSSR